MHFGERDALWPARDQSTRLKLCTCALMAFSVFTTTFLLQMKKKTEKVSAKSCWFALPILYSLNLMKSWVSVFVQRLRKRQTSLSCGSTNSAHFFFLFFFVFRSLKSATLRPVPNCLTSPVSSISAVSYRPIISRLKLLSKWFANSAGSTSPPWQWKAITAKRFNLLKFNLVIFVLTNYEFIPFYLNKSRRWVIAIVRLFIRGEYIYAREANRRALIVVLKLH